MATTGSLLFSRELGINRSSVYNTRPKGKRYKRRTQIFAAGLSSHTSLQEAWSVHLLTLRKSIKSTPTRCNILVCRSLFSPNGGNQIPILKTAATVLTRSYEAFHGRSLVVQLIPAVGIIAFAAWGLGPLMRVCRILFLQTRDWDRVPIPRLVLSFGVGPNLAIFVSLTSVTVPKSDNSWNKSKEYQVMTSYVQPLLLWGGAVLICRILEPVILPSASSQAVKQRLLNFVRSLSTVLAFAYCLSSLIQQTQKFFAENKDPSDARNMGYEFAGKAVYSAVWVASISLFMELLGFSTQKWVTAGGLGTVLLTLAGREIFTNFLSSVIIHATRPFVLNEWIQTKIQGYEVSGTVEHVGWWSPTVIRGDDREAIHIPNHQFTVNVVRNLSQKTHWRIKTHLAISHLDVNKINNIVADMRKVLAKNPQVEQQKLHRRVFLDNVDRENQALLIMISCFVKTSHFEEYLCVKEAIMLDLLRVISHHRARLATPIRTVQKIYRDADHDNVPISDIFSHNRTAAANRPFLLIEPSYKINGEDKSKLSSRPGPTTNPNIEEKDTKPIIPDPITDPNPKPTPEPKPSPSGSGTGTGGGNSMKQEVEKARSALEDNIVLGVALEGSKRMLPIEEDEMGPESKELASCLNGGKDQKDDAVPGPTLPASSNEQEKR